MGLCLTLGCLLFFGLYGICSGSVQENCTDYKLQFERVFSVPGEVAMLNSTLVSPDVFDFTTIPYNITWYDATTNGELSNQTGQILVHGETLWFLNVTLDDGGEYVSILRTPSKCFKQTTKLIVDEPVAGECGRPKKAYQVLSSGVTDMLSCPLRDYISKLDSYNITSSIQWYRGCDPIEDGTETYTYWGKVKLKIDGVTPQNNGDYTCTVTFTVGGVQGSVSETIEAWVNEKYSLVPQVRKPNNEVITLQMGSTFSMQCLVFVPCVGKPSVDIYWLAENEFIITTDPSNKTYTSEQRMWSQDAPKGVWLEKMLNFSDLREEDFYITYTCRVYSDRGIQEGYFSLQPADPCPLIPIGAGLSSVTALFILSVTVFYLYKVDIVLWFRWAFPVVYKNKDSDGKLYDAYVAYPQRWETGFNEAVDTFVLHTLPQVLENVCGYKLFIPGRDCQPGQATVDCVDENIRASRRLLLLYNASSFTGKHHTSSVRSHCNYNNNNNNNNISKCREGSQSSDTVSFDGGCPEPRQYLECVMAMHRTLLEGSLKVLLVELEEVTPTQLALFPEPVRYLRRKQGALCWWKNTRTICQRLCRKKEDKEKGGQNTNLPSSRFWKEMRYHMPVRGKRMEYPEKRALLNL